jgi:hypothetical protein
MAPPWQTRPAFPHLIYAHGEDVQVSETFGKFAWLLLKMYNAVAAQAQQRKSKKALGHAGMVR